MPWSKFKGKKAWVDIENRVDGYCPVVSHHMAQQGIEVLEWGNWAQREAFVVSDLRKDKLRDRIHWRTAFAGSWARAAEVLGQAAAQTTATGSGGLPGQLIV